MASYTPLDQHSSVVIEHSDRAGDAKILRVRGPGEQWAEVPLTPALMRELGYYCALHYRQATGKDAFLPSGFLQPVAQQPADPVKKLPLPRIRTRTTQT